MKPSKAKDKFGEVQSTTSYIAREGCRATWGPSRITNRVLRAPHASILCQKEAKNTYAF